MNNHSTAPLLARVLREGFHEGPWHGPAFVELIIDLRPHEASAHPIAGAHSIWETVVHVTATLRAMRLRVLSPTPQPDDACEWTAVTDTSEAAWYQTLRDAQDAEARLRELLIRQDPERFSPGSPRFDAELHRALVGVAESVAFHGGQIGMLRLALGLSPEAGPGPSRTPPAPPAS